MGHVLASIHFLANRDARDVEFVIGGSNLDEPCFYCIDFNQMRPHNDDVRVLVDAFKINDPYFPKPGSKYWQPFKDGYLKAAAKAGKETMGAAFIDGLSAQP
eukprot:Colp12_sorted_trinity150504_noHs@29443